MARTPDHERYGLSEGDYRDWVKLIEQGKPLPFQTLEQIAYRDTWGRGVDSFIAMIYERLILMRDWLKTRLGICSKIYSIPGIHG